MTAMLPVFALHTFNANIDRGRNYIQEPTELTLPASVRSLNSASGSVAQQLSPVSTRCILSKPATRNDENATPSVRLPHQASHNTGKVLVTDAGTTKGTLGHEHQFPALAIPTRTGLQKPNETPSSRVRHRAFFHFYKSPRYEFQNDTPRRAKQKGSEGPESQQTGSLVDAIDLGMSNATPEPFPSLIEDVKDKNEAAPAAPAAPAATINVPPSTINPVIRRRHLFASNRQRSSDASSGFVHTMKTASMSNASFSIAPRSFRIGRSSDSQGFIRGYSRHSLDSDRPVTGCSMDEAAFRRGLKRKQIINELIMTEESYVADLKALAYLYSTMLASSATIPNHLRTAIQRNVTEMVYVHETLIANLNQSMFKAAARKWADTEIPTQLELSHRGRPKNAGLYRGRFTDTKHCRIRSSIDSAEVAKAHIAIGIAEPADVLDFAKILSSLTTKLFLYEEYCANHQTIAEEFQRCMPSLWSTYESGIESLSKSLAALNKRRHLDRKGLTVGDLLIKPVQRICRYPLLLEDLLKNTPVADGPATHKVLEKVLGQFCEIVKGVNLATDNHMIRDQVQRKWLLQDRLQLSESTLSSDQFRTLGTIQLCGVLYLTYQTTALNVVGSYIVCALLDNHLLIAEPTIKSTKLELVAIISLSDLQIESATETNSLHAVSALHTWKVTFTAESDVHELLLSACSKAEEDQWVRGLRGYFRPKHFLQLSTMFDESRVWRTFRSLDTSFRTFTPFSLHSPTHASTASPNSSSICQVILRNTYNAQDWHDVRNISPSIADRSHLQAKSTGIVVLAPKRVERTRLETNANTIYTKDRLPFPSMIGSKGSRIIRASAGSLVRKLSFASMQATFSRRSASLSSKKSYHTIHTVQRQPQTFSIRKHSIDAQTPTRSGVPKELPELDTMDSVIERMIGSSTARKRLSFSNGEKLVRKNTKTSRTRRASSCQIGPDDPAMLFYNEANNLNAVEGGQTAMADGKNPEVECEVPKKKRWSNPIGRLKGLGNDGLKNILYSSK